MVWSVDNLYLIKTLIPTPPKATPSSLITDPLPALGSSAKMRRSFAPFNALLLNEFGDDAVKFEALALAAEELAVEVAFGDELGGFESSADLVAELWKVVVLAHVGVDAVGHSLETAPTDFKGMSVVVSLNGKGAATYRDNGGEAIGIFTDAHCEDLAAAFVAV